MRIAVIGGGINGLCTAWQLALLGHEVSLFERGELMGATSQCSSKLLHGGLRYLEHGEFGLVREALRERRWWLKHAPRLTHRLAILYPIYQNSRRSRWLVKLGLWLYDTMAGRKNIGRHRWLPPQRVLRCSPHLKKEGLKGAYLFFDGQMDDHALGLWVATLCRKAGVQLHEYCPVQQVNADGGVLLATPPMSAHPDAADANDAAAADTAESHTGEISPGENKPQWLSFDRVINTAGPWSEQLLRQSALTPQQPLDLVRGSHLVLPTLSRYGHMLEVPGEARVAFVLPYQGKTLLGTTEVRQSVDDPVACSTAERDYLLNVYNHYFRPERNAEQVQDTFSGLRPLLAGSRDTTRASREYRLHWQGKLLTVSGGKWTTARALGRKVAQAVGRR